MRSDEINTAVLPRFFSSSLLKELATHGNSPSMARLIEESRLVGNVYSEDRIGTLFDQAFRWLRHRRHRHEYIYIAALTEKVLLGTHSLNTATMMKEFNIGRCKADVVILNGTSNVYEIKSERDSLRRLNDQIRAYSRVFAKVNIIVGENHLQEARSLIPDHVGVMVLSDRYQVSTLRSAIEDPGRTDAAAIFDAINQKEAGEILRSLGMIVPEVPNTERYHVLRKMFLDLDSETAHGAMVECLLHTRSLRKLSGFLESVPKSLVPAILSLPLTRRERTRLIYTLRTPICDALGWSY